MDKIDFILQSLTNGDEIKIRKYMAKLANLFCLAKYREDKYVHQTLSFLGDIMRLNNFSLEIQADIFRCFSNIIKNEKYMDDILKLKPLHLCKNILWNFQPNTNLIKNVCRFLLKFTNIHNIKQMYLYDDLAYIVVSLYNAVPYLDTLDDKQLYYDQLNTVLLRMFLVITGNNLSESSKTAKRTKLQLLNTSGFFDTTNTPFESLLNPEFLNNLQVNLFANVTNDLDAKAVTKSLTLYDLFIQMLSVSEINHAFGTVGLIKVLFVLLQNHYSAHIKSSIPSLECLHNTLNILILTYHLSLESSNRARIRDFGGLILLLDLTNWFLRCNFGLKTTNFSTIDDHILTTFVAIFKNFLYDTLSAHVLMSHGIFHFLNGVLKHFLGLTKGKLSRQFQNTPSQQDIELEINSNQHSESLIENNDNIMQVKKDVDPQTLDYQSIVHSFIGYETLFEAFSTNRYLNPLVVVLENNDNSIVDTSKNTPCDSPNDSNISPTCTINSSPHNSEYCFSVSSQSPKYNYYFGTTSPSHYPTNSYKCASHFSNSPGSSTETGACSSYYGSLLSSPTYAYFDNNQYGGGTANYINVSVQSSCCNNDYSSEEEFYIEELSSTTASFNNHANDKMDILGQGIEANVPTNTTDVSIEHDSAKSDHPNLNSPNEMNDLQNLSFGSHNTDLRGTTNLNSAKSQDTSNIQLKHCLKRDVSTTLQDTVTILLFQLKMMETQKYLGKNIELFHTLIAFLMQEDKIKPPPKILIKTLLRLVKDTRYTHILMQCGIPPLIYALKVYHDVQQSLCCTSSIATISDEHKLFFNDTSHKPPKIKRRKMNIARLSTTAPFEIKNNVNENGGSSKNLIGYLTKLLKCLQQSFRDAQAIDHVKKVLQTCDTNTDYRMSQSDMLVLLSLPFLESKNGFKRILHDYNYVTRLHTLITSQPYHCLKGGYLFDNENEYDQNGLPDYQNSSTSCYTPYILLAIHYINQNIPNSTYEDTNLHNVFAKNLAIPKLIAFARTLLEHDRTHKIILNDKQDVQGDWDWILCNTKGQQISLPGTTQKLPIESIVHFDLNQAPESYKLLLREQSQFFATLLSCGDAAFFSEHHKPNEIILKDISTIDFANVLHYLRMYHHQKIMSSPSSPYVILASTYFPTHIRALIEKFLGIYRYSHRFLLIELECWIRTYVIPSLVLFYCSNLRNIEADIYGKTYTHHHLTTMSEVIDMICTYYTEYYLLEALNYFKEFVVNHSIFLATFNATPIDVIYNFPYMFDFGPQSSFFDSIFDCYNNAVIQL